MKELLFLYIVAGVLPTVAIYYFTRGNWPLAFWLQLGLFIILLVAYVVLWLKFISGGTGGGGRGSNPIGAAAGAAGVLIFIAPLVIGVGTVVLAYRGMPAGEPGMLVQPIKWTFLLVILAGFILFVYHSVNDNLLTRIYILPNFIKQPLYESLLEKDLSYDRGSQLEESFLGEMQSRDNLESVLILVRKKSLLIGLVDIHRLESEHKDYYREAVLTILCNRVATTGYPDNDHIEGIFSRVISEEKPVAGVVLTALDCMKNAGFREKLYPEYIEDLQLLGTIWDNYPAYRHSILPKVSAKTFLQKRLESGDTLPDVNLIMENLVHTLQHYPNESVYSMLQFIISNFNDKLDYSKGTLHEIAEGDNEWSYRLLYENKFPESAWKSLRYDENILNTFTDNNGVRIRLVVSDNESEEEKAKVERILDFINFLKDKGMNKIRHKGEYSVTEKLLRERYGLTGFVDD